MSSLFLDSIPIWLVYVGLLLVFLVSVETGLRLGRWRRARAEAGQAGEIATDNTATAALLTLAGFLLAFTFATAGGHFNDRRMLAIDDANAIGTVFLRADHLPEPHRSTVRGLLGDYVEDRHLVEWREFLRFVARSESLHAALWAEANAAAAKAPTPLTALFVASLNDMFDLHNQRADTEQWIPVPPMIFMMLVFLSALAMVMAGHTQGLTGKRFQVATPLVVIAYATVFLLVVDLDRPVRGFFFVSQEPMLELREEISDVLAEYPTS